MRASDFLTELEVTPYQYRDLGINKAMDFLNGHCRQALATIKNPIWRGMKNHKEDIVFADPSTGKRMSQNTTNQYTALIDSSPYFKGWPKRSSSFVCSSNRSYASQFSKGYDASSTLYAIFPFDGVKIAVCPTRDMWQVPISIPAFNKKFNHGGWGDDLDMFNGWLTNEVGITADSEGNLKFDGYQLGLFAKDHNLQKHEIVPILQKALSPQRAGFKLVTIGEFASGQFNDNELWIGGPVICIREPLYKQFLNAYEKQGQINASK